jgi:hypothetical protein
MCNHGEAARKLCKKTCVQSDVNVHLYVVTPLNRLISYLDTYVEGFPVSPASLSITYTRIVR